MRRWIVGVICALAACTTWASGNSNDVRKHAEASMLVIGWIEVMPNGSVHDFSIDRPEKIPPAVIDTIRKNVPNWKFRLTDHTDAIQRARMYVRITAKPIDESHDAIIIAGATFGDGQNTSSEHVTYKDEQPPKYPREAVASRVDGTVFLLLRVGRQGQVQDAAVEQVNLGVYGSEMQMRHFREVLGDAALDVAHRWTFNLPTTGKHVMDPYWIVKVPIDFDLHPAGTPAKDTYGEWKPYIPGPRESIPWAKSDSRFSASSDAIPDGTISQADQPLQLMTSLDGA